MTCPFLDYRREADDLAFDEARAYCTAADRFVQPMRADVCTDRYDLSHDEDCEIYLDHADEAGSDHYDSDRNRGDHSSDAAGGDDGV